MISEKKTAKGIVRNVIKNHLKHENYKQILETGERMNSSMKMIRSFDHNVYTVNVTKISLSAYDDNRFIKDDGISSYAYGHFRINEHGEIESLSQGTVFELIFYNTTLLIHEHHIALLCNHSDYTV